MSDSINSINNIKNGNIGSNEKTIFEVGKKDVGSIFRELDVNNDGCISKDEAKEKGFTFFMIDKTLEKADFESQFNSKKQLLNSLAPYQPMDGKTPDKVPTRKDLKSYYFNFSTGKPIDGKLDFSKSIDILRITSFDDKTFANTPKEYLPKDFNPQKVLEDGKMAGNNIMALRKMGITGKGINVAILDWRLSPHKDYNDNLVSYKEMTNAKGQRTFHATAVAGQMVGKNRGSAPNAKLHHYACANGGTEHIKDNIAAFRDILEYNKKASEKDKIRVISMSASLNWPHYSDADKAEAKKLIEELKKTGCELFSSDDCWKNFWYADKLDPTKSNNSKDNNLINFTNSKNLVFLQTGNATVPSPLSDKGYRTDSRASASWTIPVIAGLYASALQVNPKLSKEEFIKLTKETATEEKAQLTAEAEISDAGIDFYIKEVCQELGISHDDLEKNWDKVMKQLQNKYSYNLENVVQSKGFEILLKKGIIDENGNYKEPKYTTIKMLDAVKLMEAVKNSKK